MRWMLFFDGRNAKRAWCAPCLRRGRLLLERHWAIVTGAAGGIGKAMTRGLLAAGIKIAGVDRDREPLEALATTAREQGKAAELLTV
jgi:hypothetical protein